MPRIFEHLLDIFLHNREHVRTFILVIQHILACSFMVQSDMEAELYDTYLFNIANDTKGSRAEPDFVQYDENTRADALDVLSTLGSTEDVRHIANNMLRVLGKGGYFYTNSQNIHSVSDVSVKNIISEMKSKMTIIFIDNHIGIVSTWGGNVAALERIQNDMATYHNYSLYELLIVVIDYIHKFKGQPQETLRHRLLEELNDMDGTCSTGYFYRLLNVVSGFTYTSISIPWKEQIVSNFIGRMNAKLRLKCQEDDTAFDILDEMTVESILKRPLYNMFFKENIPLIVSELQTEFKNYVKGEEFEEAIKSAIIIYQSGDDKIDLGKL